MRSDIITTDGLICGDPVSIVTGGYAGLFPSTEPEPVEPKTYKRRVDYALVEEAPSFGLSFNSYIGKIYKNTFIKTKKDIDVDFVQ